MYLVKNVCSLQYLILAVFGLFSSSKMVILQYIHFGILFLKVFDVFGIKCEENLDNVFANVNAAIIVTGHDEFKKLQLSEFNKMNDKILIDTRGIIEPILAKDAGLVFRGLGRGQ